MSDVWSVVAPLFFILFAPTLIHLAALRGAEFYPIKKPRSEAARFLVYRAIRPILMLNGVTFCVSYLLWRFESGAWWIVGIVIAIPGLVAQLIALAIAKHSDVVNS